MDRVSVLSLAVGMILPLLTAAVTKESWPEWVKQVILALLSTATGVAVEVERGTDAPTVIAANALTAFASAVAVSAGTWRPTGVLGRLEALFIRDVADTSSEKSP